MSDRDRILRVILSHGLGLRPSELTAREASNQLAVVDELLRDNDASTLYYAIRYGMPEVWPFSEDGRAYDAVDVRSNILKAKAAVGRLRQSGKLPHTPSYRR